MSRRERLRTHAAAATHYISVTILTPPSRNFHPIPRVSEGVVDKDYFGDKRPKDRDKFRSYKKNKNIRKRGNELKLGNGSVKT